MLMSRPPDADIIIDRALVERLLAAQRPDLCGTALQSIGHGWDNALWRIGEHAALRLPRRALAADLVLHEQHWLPVLAPRLPVPIPAPIWCGVPGAGYPWHWSIVPWYDGVPASGVSLGPTARSQLAATLNALHQPAPTDAPLNPLRGVALHTRSDAFEARVAGAAQISGIAVQSCRAAWHEAIATPIDVAPCWIHGDLHPGNLLIADDQIAALLDWGDLCAGDPATDLAAWWMLVADGPTRHAMLTQSASAATIRRARGWALFFGVMFAAAGQHDATAARLGTTTLQRVMQECTV